MNDKQWFKFYQPSLLGLVNTDHGRDLFDISRDLPTIVEIGPWYYRWLIGKDQYQTEFHSKAVYFRKLLHRWNEIVSGLEHPLFVPKYVVHNGRKLAVPMGGATATVYPNAHTESSSVDGHVGFVGLDDKISWSTATTDNGDNVTQIRDSHGTINCTVHYNGGWEDFTRGFLLFDTSGIGSVQSVSAAVLSFTSSQNNTTATEDTWTIVASTPASNTALVAADYDNVASTSFGSIESTAVTTDSSTYNDITLNASGRSAVAVAGVTKFGVRWEADRADSEEQSSNQIIMLSADTASNSKDPKLVVTHAVGADIDNINGIALSSIQAFNGITQANAQSINGITF